MSGRDVNYERCYSYFPNLFKQSNRTEPDRDIFCPKYSRIIVLFLLLNALYLRVLLCCIITKMYFIHLAVLLTATIATRCE